MRKFCLLMTIIFVLNISACSETSGPEQDDEAPNAVVQLSIYPMNTGTPHSFSFCAISRNSNDNISSVDDLRVRWDFENDGQWDTEFQGLVTVADFVPGTLPVDEWQVKCEMQDAAGNSTLHTESLTLPEWLPIPPDIIAGEVNLMEPGLRTSLGDTVTVGDNFLISLPRQDWLNEDGLTVTQRYYVDDQLIGEESSSTFFPDPVWHRLPRSMEYEGFQTSGFHEIRVDLELSDDHNESNSDNNSASRIVFAVQQIKGVANDLK